MKIIHHLVKSIVCKIQKPDPVIFDIGCGDAFVAHNIATTFPGAAVHAVDTAFHLDIMTKIREMTCNDNLFLHDRIENISLPAGKSADIVLLLDVLEHIGDDAGFLKQLLNTLYVSENTYFIITAPAFPGLYSSHDELLKHCRRYTNKSLMKTLRLSGYQSLKSGYFFFVLLFPRIFRLYLEKLRLVKSSVNGIGHWQGYTLVTRIILFILQIDNFILRMFLSMGINLPGLSVYSICKPAVS
jgi:trans-aconitate methyltransferase